MRGLLFILGVLVLLVVAAMQIGLVRFAEPERATDAAQASTLEAEAALVSEAEPAANRAQ